MLKEPLLLPDEDESARRVNRACYHIRDAMHGVVRAHPSDSRASHAAYTAHLKIIAPLLQPWCFGYLCLTFFEPPLWCLRAKQRFHTDLCTSPLYPSFDIPKIRLSANLLLELGALSFLLADLALLVAAQGWVRYLGSCRQRAALTFLTLAVVDVIYAYSTPVTWWRAAPYLRACLYVVHTPAVRFQLSVMRQMVPRFGGVALLIVLYILLFAWLATE